jgi:hypothetical protein
VVVVAVTDVAVPVEEGRVVFRDPFPLGARPADLRLARAEVEVGRGSPVLLVESATVVTVVEIVVRVEAQGMSQSSSGLFQWMCV